MIFIFVADILSHPPSTHFLLPLEKRTPIYSNSGQRFLDIRKGRFQERNPAWSKLVMIISCPLASNWSEERYVAQFWLMRCKQRSVREGVSFQTISQNPAQNKDATLEAWHPSCNHEDKSLDHRAGRAERSSKSMLI